MKKKYITSKDYQKAETIAEKAIENIPKSYNRKRDKTYFNALIKALDDVPERREGKAK